MKKIESKKGKEQWCDHCLDERKKAWEDARARWWDEMDLWLQTGEGSNAPGVQKRS